MMMQQDFLSTLDNSSSSSSSTCQQQQLAVLDQHTQQEINRTVRPPPSFLGVRKSPAKPWKKPAVDPPVPPKIYRVEPRGFRQLVQELTGAPPPQPQPQQQQPQPPPPPPPPPSLAASTRRFRDAAPAPLELGQQQLQQQEQQQQQMMVGYPTDHPFAQFQYSSSLTPLSVGGQQSSLFSAYMAWSSHPVLSPGTMASLEQSTVL